MRQRPTADRRPLSPISRNVNFSHSGAGQFTAPIPSGRLVFLPTRTNAQQVQTDVQATHLNSRRNEMKKMIAAIALGLFSVAALADPCMDANVSPLGYSFDKSADELHLDEQGC